MIHIPPTTKAVEDALRENNTGPLREYIAAGGDVSVFNPPLYAFGAVVSDIELVKTLFGLGMRLTDTWSFFHKCERMSDEVFDYALSNGLFIPVMGCVLYYVRNNPQRLIKLLSRGANIYEFTSDFHLLGTAVKENKKDMVRFWVEAGFDVNYGAEDGCTALYVATISKECGTDMLDLLVELGADIAFKETRGRNAAVSIACSIQPETISLQKLEWILSNLPELIAVPDYEGMTALHHAAVDDKKQLVEFLVLRADIHAKDADGDTPLDLCIQQDNAGCFGIIFNRLRDIGEMPTAEEERLWRACGRFGAEKIKQFMLENQMGSVFI